jgi:DNA polymerase-3 subunit gamma/tau
LASAERSTPDDDSATAQPATPAAPVSLQQLKDAWPQILELVQKAKMSAWTVVYTSQVRALEDDVLTLSFVSQNDVDSFKQPAGAGDGVSEILRRAIQELLGIRVKFIARAEAAAPEPTPSRAAAPAVDEAGWAVATIPSSGESAPEAAPAAVETGQEKKKAPAARAEAAPKLPVAVVDADPVAPAAPSSAHKGPNASAAPSQARYGEAVVRELLGANFIEEHEVAPRVVPLPQED